MAWRAYALLELKRGAGMAMIDPNISWERTFPESEPGTDAVAVFDNRVIGRVQYPGPRDPVWSWSITDTDLAGRPGWANTHGETTRAGRPWTA